MSSYAKEEDVEFPIRMNSDCEGEFLVALREALSAGWSEAMDLEEMAAPACRFFLVCYRRDQPSASIALWRLSDGFAINPAVWTGDHSREIKGDRAQAVLADFMRSCLFRIEPSAIERLGIVMPGLPQNENPFADLIPE